MCRRVLLRAICLLVLVSPAVAQTTATGSVRIHVTYDSDRAAPENLLVQLVSGAGSTPVGTAYTNDAGIAEFNKVGIGVYHVVVTGNGIARTESTTFEIDPGRPAQTEFVSVEHADGRTNIATSKAMVDAGELKVPGDALKQFEKASQAMNREDWNKARDALSKAIDSYPQYAAAYNNLAIVYSRMGDLASEGEALHKAIVADEHFAPAYVNLGELCIRQTDYNCAEVSLTRAVSLDPRNAKAFMLLADANLLNKQYEAAIENARRAHSLPHDRLALTHYISAKAYEHENRRQDAISELRLFLQEEPQGARADHMRDEIKQLQHYTQ